MKRVISNLKKSNASANSDSLWTGQLSTSLLIHYYQESYGSGTIDQRLKQDKYSSVAAFISDFELIVDNCFAFNVLNMVFRNSKEMQSSFNSQMRNLPPASIDEPSKRQRKLKEARTH